MTVTGLFIYPIKSLGAISLDTAIATVKGFRLDRRWMILDDKGKFLTQRTLPQMTQIIPEIVEDEIVLRSKINGKSASFPIKDKYGDSYTSKVWSDAIEVQNVPGAVNDFLSEQLGKTCQLVFFPEKNPRLRTKSGVTEVRISNLSDKSPILLANEASLTDLNEKLESPVEMERFRANIIYRGKEAWEEDNFSTVKVGSLQLEKVEVCGRCPLINVQQDSGATSKEPLQTLRTYRTDANDKQVKFGVRYNVLLSKEAQGEVKVGDKIRLMK